MLVLGVNNFLKNNTKKSYIKFSIQQDLDRI